VAECTAAVLALIVDGETAVGAMKCMGDNARGNGLDKKDRTPDIEMKVVELLVIAEFRTVEIETATPASRHICSEA